MQRKFLFFFILLNLTPLALVHAVEKRNKVEEFLIWKMSEELKLTAEEEKKFSEIVKKLNAQKTEQNHQMQDAIDQMKSSKAKGRDEELTRYRKALVAYNKISENEFDELKPLLGTERMAQYLYIKQDLASRIKSLLLTPEGAGKAKPPLPQPKLIEEK